MSTFTFCRVRHYLIVLGCLILTFAPASGQSKPGQQQQGQVDDVVRVNTELVQTDVMVFDKKGQFVDGLKAEQFALKIDNKPQPISPGTGARRRNPRNCDAQNKSRGLAV